MPVSTTTPGPRARAARRSALAALAALALAAPVALTQPAQAAPVVGTTAAPLANASTAERTASSAAARASLSGTLSSILDDARSRTETDVSVLDADTGATVYGRRASSPNLPASNAKILTAVTALHVLGPDYRFTTDVVRRGSVTAVRIL
ncbi:MAG: hypothetical protein EOP01_06610, partial [Propionibacteriaceae bacterium]